MVARPLKGRTRARPGRALASTSLFLAALCGGLGACAGGAPEPARACLTVQASPNLNLYEGQAHAVTLYLFPLTGTLGFEQASVPELIGGLTPPGAAGSPIPITVAPGEKREFEEALPPAAVHVGIVADYYRDAADEEGVRRVIVPAQCGWFSETHVTLSPHDVLVEK